VVEAVGALRIWEDKRWERRKINLNNNITLVYSLFKRKLYVFPSVLAPAQIGSILEK